VDLLSFFSPGNSALGVICGVVAVFLGIEIYRFRSHTKVLEKIPIRIHVNGSRGKSSVTRLIGAAMRKTQYVTVTKTTGTAPRFIMPDGVEIPVFRPGKPNIIEQLRLVAEARNLGADALGELSSVRDRPCNGLCDVKFRGVENDEPELFYVEVRIFFERLLPQLLYNRANAMDSLFG